MEERIGPRPKLPEHMQPMPAESSRLLKGAQKQNQERVKQRPPSGSYRKAKAGESNV